MYKIIKTDDEELVNELHDQLFPDVPEMDGDDFWVVWDGDTPVGFAAGRASYAVGHWYMLTRAGVLKAHRGQGLQKRLIRVREAFAKREGYEGVLTYAANWNTPSIISLLKSGYFIYDPEVKAKGRGWKKKRRDGYVYLSRRL